MKKPLTGKAQQLLALRTKLGEHVPLFIVLPASLTDAVVLKKIQHTFTKETSLIFRSSAQGEDAGDHSFAGLFESILNVPASDTTGLITAYRECAESIHAPRVKTYCRQHAIPEPSFIEIIVQEYKKPELGGVAFLYPQSPEQSIVSIGVGHSVTDGGEAAATLAVAMLPTMTSPVMSPQLCHGLHRLLAQLESNSTEPVDVEWIAHRGKIYIVQSRPITAVTSPFTFGEEIFDSTNIGENYPGITAPLTFSFVRSAYTGVYTHFLQLLGTPDSIITENKYATSHLVGYVQGRIYYNLINWYRLLKHLPFYSVIKKFFNTMLKPVKSLDAVDAEPSQVRFYSGLKFCYVILFPGGNARAFEKGFDELFSHFDVKRWRTYTSIELLNRYEQLRDSFFRLWAHTIVNDFHVMVFWGLLNALARKTYHQPNLYLNSVVNSDMFPESVAPLHALERLADTIRSSKTLQHLFSLSADQVLKNLTADEQYNSFKTEFDRYLQLYGDRSGQELKLEVPKFIEQPDQVILLLQAYVHTKKTSAVQPKISQMNTSVTRPWLVPLVSWIRHIAVKGIYRREKFRLMRGKAYGIARAVFLELGSRLQAHGLLLQKEDVFFLDYDELTSLMQYHRLPSALQPLVVERKKQMKEYGKHRPTTRVLAYNWNLDDSGLVMDEGTETADLTGTGTSITAPVTARVVVMEEFSVSIPLQNCILITKKTDPGWTVLFPMIAGIVTEVGSTLSHASIIARELGIPCITGVKNCTSILKTGDEVTLIPETGKVIRKNI